MLYNEKWAEAQTFKSAKELRIGRKIHAALIQVYWLLKEDKIPARLFDMSTLGSPNYPRLSEDNTPCGSAGCILGWAHAVDPSVKVLHDNQLYGAYRYGSLGKLFYPGAPSAYRANRSQAAQALFTYLTTGRADWKKAMSA